MYKLDSLVADWVANEVMSLFEIEPNTMNKTDCQY